MKDALDIKKLRKAKPEEIEARVLELKKTLMEKRFALANGSLKDTSSIAKARRAIATLKGYATNAAPGARVKPETKPATKPARAKKEAKNA